MDAVATMDDLRAWVRLANRCEWRAYHVGELARARAADAAVDELAALALALDRAGFIRTIQSRREAGPDTAYLAVRRGKPAGSHPLLCDLPPYDYLAARALMERSVSDDRQSAARIVARSCGLSDCRAAETLADLQARKLVELRPSSRRQPRPMLTRAGLDLCFA